MGGPINLPLHLAEFLLGALSHLLHIGASPLKLLLLVADGHDFAAGRLEVLLELLQFAAFLEEGLAGGAALILQNLFAFEVGTFCTLHEFVAVVLITDF